MDSVEANGWKVNTEIFANKKIDEYIKIIGTVNNMHENNEYYIKPKKFKHSFRGTKYLPLFYDSTNNVNYLALGFVFDSYGHLGFNRIEIRNRKAYIFIADKNYFDGKIGNIKVKIFNTCSIKYIIAASVHMDDKMKFILKYDGKNTFCCGMVPENAYFVIDAEILRKKCYFNESISFGTETIKVRMGYNCLKIKRVRFDSKECCGIIQGGKDHQFLYKLGIEMGNHMEKI
jgi:hypothetical protein